MLISSRPHGITVTVKVLPSSYYWNRYCANSVSAACLNPADVAIVIGENSRGLGLKNPEFLLGKHMVSCLQELESCRVLKLRFAGVDLGVTSALPLLLGELLSS